MELCTLYLLTCQVSYCRRLRSLLLCWCCIFRAPVNSLALRVGLVINENVLAQLPLGCVECREMMFNCCFVALKKGLTLKICTWFELSYI